MKPPTEPLPDPLAELLHEASLDPRAWPDALGALGAYVSADSAPCAVALCFDDPTAFRSGWMLVNLPDSDEWRYSFEGAGQHPLFLRATQHGEGFVGPSESFASPDDLARTTLARQCLRDDKSIHGVSSLLLADGVVTSLHVLRQPRHKGVGTPAATRLRAALSPVRRAVQVYLRLRRARQLAAIDEGLLDQLDVASFAVTPTGRLVRSNTAGRALLARGGALCVEDGALVGATRVGALRLREAMLRCARSEDRNAFELVMAPWDDGQRRPLLVFVSTVAHRMGTRPDHLLVMARDLGGDTGSLSVFLKELYDLTPTETRLTLALAEGGSTEEIAETLGCAVPTLRTHLKNIFEKTSVHRQNGLVRLALGELPPVRVRGTSGG